MCFFTSYFPYYQLHGWYIPLIFWLDNAIKIWKTEIFHSTFIFVHRITTEQVKVCYECFWHFTKSKPTGATSWTGTASPSRAYEFTLVHLVCCLILSFLYSLVLFFPPFLMDIVLSVIFRTTTSEYLIHVSFLYTTSTSCINNTWYIYILANRNQFMNIKNGESNA